MIDFNTFTKHFLRMLGKLIVAKGFKKLPKVQTIARSGHTEIDPLLHRLDVPCDARFENGD